MRANLPANTPHLRQRCRRVTYLAARSATGVRKADCVFEVASLV
ncbi:MULTISPECIES: hypothetical protein [Streptomyces]|jgi:hypothetical protein|nr:MULTISPECIES: hypothetical protein [unclassified Streptomyces]MDX2624962.1 hypothetical protein [Streptomyces sp. WI03-5b]